MLYINENAIKLTRGDTAYLSVSLQMATGEEYIMSKDDELTLTIKENTFVSEELMRKTITGESIFHIKPTDTCNIPFGKYKYDIQLTTSNGDVYTVIDVDTFEILQEVTC